MQGLVVRAQMSGLTNSKNIMSFPSHFPLALLACPFPKKRATSTSVTSNKSSLPHNVSQDEFSTESSEKWQKGIKEALVQGTGSCDQTAMMELIDTIQRLGIGHYFEGEIQMQLHELSSSSAVDDNDLFSTALRFRLLRHNGLWASTDVFKKFVNERGQFDDSLIEDTKGMLSLYEASYMGTKDEDILFQAMEFTTNHLKQSLMELPRHLRMQRLESRNYINEYSNHSNCNLDVLELAMFDFNRVQLQHQEELAEIIRWWKELGLVDKLGFGRDRPLECFLWTVGIFPEPYQSSCRIELTKTISILLVLDDVFDTYGGLDELVLFEDAIKRWDLGAMEDLPEYMKICYMALYNTTNDIAYKILKEHGLNIVSHLRRTWKDIIEAFLVEAMWCNRGYVPTLEEYLENGVTTGGTYMALVHSFFLMGQGVTKETIALLDPYPNLLTRSGRVLRLWDDLGTAQEEQERGDVASSIECYMKEKGIGGEEEGRRQIRQMIRELWVELNGELVAQNGLPLSLISASLNVARTAQVVYQHGDDNTFSGVEDHAQALFFRPIGS
uniref:Terpene synthase n=1 Tax=Pelargonium graveolens TaxID=73200 RepID=A0A2S1JKY6_9ROSI|nr:terpene synthase [Pelargonium graveolens]